MIELSHALGKRVVAEGVETMPQLDFLREHGCDEAQGFLLAPPLAAREVTHRLTWPALVERPFRADDPTPPAINGGGLRLAAALRPKLVAGISRRS